MRAFLRGATAIAAMIASVAAVCDLDLVVIGGGVAKAGPVLFDPLREALRTYARLDFIADLRVVPAALGGEAGLVGAAALLRDSLGASRRKHPRNAAHFGEFTSARGKVGGQAGPFWLIGEAPRYSWPVPPKTVGHRAIG